jgi:hypothetical protein
MASQKFENNWSFNAARRSLKSGKRSSHWNYLCPAEKAKLLEEFGEGQKLEVHEGRWGFYPCDKETYFKLKELHKFYMKAVQLEYQWQRWDRKDPDNRVIKRHVRNAKGQKIGSMVVGPMPEPKRFSPFYKDGFLEHAEIMVDYQNAKKPKSKKEDVKPLLLSKDQIGLLLAKAKDWQSSLDKQKLAG